MTTTTKTRAHTICLHASLSPGHEILSLLAGEWIVLQQADDLMPGVTSHSERCHALTHEQTVLLRHHQETIRAFAVRQSILCP